MIKELGLIFCILVAFLALLAGSFYCGMMRAQNANLAAYMAHYFYEQGFDAAHFLEEAKNNK